MFLGKADVDGKVRANQFHQPAGVMATACRQKGTSCNTGSPSGDRLVINWQLARVRPGRLG